MTLDEISDRDFLNLLQQARTNNQALEALIDLFVPEMITMANFIKQPREDSIQQMKMAFISLIRDEQAGLELNSSLINVKAML
ncbi:hypothetical protein [Brevibacillus sp. NRS-1366]|uniref:hypothetical protein n=1 Tax=Brevibacillus sp. NRS-1366 TaxID=3233899 RepID=UPI003D1E934E